MSRYRVLRDAPQWDAKEGAEQEFDFSIEEENEYVGAGLVELLPREYEVIGTSVVYETEPGGKFEAAIPRGQEELLLGYHLKRVLPPGVPAKSASRADWDKYAKQVGLDPDAFDSKEDLIQAVEEEKSGPSDDADKG